MFDEDKLNDAMRTIVRWLSSSSEWLELESERLRVGADHQQWEAENEALSDTEESFCWEFRDEWA